MPELLLSSIIQQLAWNSPKVLRFLQSIENREVDLNLLHDKAWETVIDVELTKKVYKVFNDTQKRFIVFLKGLMMEDMLMNRDTLYFISEFFENGLRTEIRGLIKGEEEKGRLGFDLSKKGGDKQSRT